MEEKSNILENYLTQENISFEVVGSLKGRSLLESADIEKIPLENFLRAELVINNYSDEKFLIITNLDKVIDYKLLSEHINNPIPYEASFAENFYNKGVKSYVPISNLLGVKGIVDEAINFSQDVYIISPESIYKILGSNFEKLCTDNKKCTLSSLLSIDININNNSNGNNSNGNIVVLDKFSKTRMKTRIVETEELPVIPVMASEILQLRVNPNAEATDLALIVEKDPSLAAQLMSWARSPYYGFKGKITSVRDAIIKVLGYDLVMNVSLGIAISKVMQIPTDGVIGLKEFWRCSIYSAFLIEKLVDIMSFRKKPHKGLAYLCGLLHNFGYLLLGQLFPPHFELLNQTIALNREINVLHLERKICDTDHQEIGAWLMEAWNMPKELIAATKYHHQEKYFEENSIYVNLVYISDYLLANKGIGDTSVFIGKEISMSILEHVGFTIEQAVHEVDELWKKRETIESLINLLH